jgi:hypothetical protein
MTGLNSTDDIINALRKVPVKSLRLVELANEIPIINGKFDPYVLQDRKSEIALAIQEAQMYGTHTLQAVESLINIRGEAPKEV